MFYNLKNNNYKKQIRFENKIVRINMMNDAVVEDALTLKYNNYLRNIFSWGVFRNKTPANRKDLNLDEMKKFCELMGNPH